MSDTLGEALPKETARVRELIKLYQSIGPAGQFALMMIERSLKAADKAMIEGDVVAMIQAYEDLKGFEE